MCALDRLLPEDHQARVVWAFVEQQDLSALYALIRATEDRPGRTPVAPQLLMAEGLVTPTRVAQDGMRVRARAGASSCRRRPALEKCLEEARAQVEALHKELEESPESSTLRERAARERQERVRRALDKRELLRAKKLEKEREKARVSTTDPEVPGNRGL